MTDIATPFCSQPWSTLYVQWDGKVTRPCIRGPQNMGSLVDVEDIETFWNGPSLRAVRKAVASERGMNAACKTCWGARSRTIDHLSTFGAVVGGDFGYDKIENYYASVDAHATADTELLSRPVVLVLDLSSKCHIRCPKCFVYNSDMQYGLGHMPDAVFDKITPLFRTALEVIGHENGECMLHKKFFDFVRVIKSNNCRFMFNTTGQLIDAEKANLLVELQVDKIMFSIDSVEPESYSYLHKGGALGKLMNGIAAINAEKEATGSRLPRLGWYFVACKSNIGQLADAVRMAVDLGFSMIYVGHLNKPNGEQYRSYFDFYRDESLFRDPVDRARYNAAVSSAREVALSNGMEFFTGSADA